MVSFIILWICVIVMDLPNWPILGLGGSHAYADFGLHCSFAITTNAFYNTIMYTGWAVLLPAAVIFFCYLNILIRTSSQFFMTKIQRFEEKIVQDRTFEPNSNCFRCVKKKVSVKLLSQAAACDGQAYDITCGSVHIGHHGRYLPLFQDGSNN